MDNELKHFTRPFRVGNIIILVLGGIFAIPLFLGLVGMAVMQLFGISWGGR
jgi:hypothetical protein